MRELNRPRPRVLKTKQPLPLGGIGNLDQHRGRARLSTPVGGRSRDIQFPNRRYSFTSQHPDGEFSSKDLAGHGVRSGAASWQSLPLDREFGGLPLTTFDSADPMTPASSDCEIEFKLAAALCSVCHAAMRIDDEFVRDAGVESRVALGCGIEADDLRIDDFANRQPVPEDRLQQLAVVAQHGCLAGVKAVRLGPALTEPQAQRTVLRVLVLGAGIFGDLEARNTDRAGWAGDLHCLVQHKGGLIRPGAALCLEPDAIDEGVYLGHLQNLRNPLAERRIAGQINGLETDSLRMLQARLVEIADQHARSPEQA